MFQIVYEFPFIRITLLTHRLPNPSAVPFALFKFAFVSLIIGPKVETDPVSKTVSVASFIAVSTSKCVLALTVSQ